VNIFLRILKLVKRLILDPVPHDKFDEWPPASTSQFIREYHVKRVDRSKLTKCDPTCPLVESEGCCVYLLDDQCMLDGLQSPLK